MLLGISLDVGQENLATIQGAGGEVEAGVELGGGAVIFFEDFGGCGFFVVDPLELFFQDLLVFVFGNVIFQEFPELVQAGVGGGVHLISKFVHFLLSAGCLELEVEIVVGGFAGVIAAIVPEKEQDNYVEYISRFVGKENVYPMDIRAIGAVHIG